MSVNMLKILVVEDSVDDCMLLVAELERHGYTPVMERVETPGDFLLALQDHVWDAVIADYVLPRFSGPDALKILRNQEQDIPFIVVSGVFGEEMAVAMMKAGADDYILKSNLSRLVPALERELEAAQARRRNKRATGAAQYLAAIVESSEDAIYGKSLDGTIVSWNPAAERLFGYSAEEIIGRSVFKLFPQARRDEMLDILSGISHDRIVGIRETERLHKNGKMIPVSVTVSPIKNAVGEIIGASSIAHDISAQKQAERELQAALAEREKLVDELQQSLEHVKALSGLLPICAFCHKIRNSDGVWERLEAYISDHSEASFTHGFCPECNEKHYGVKPSESAHHHSGQCDHDHDHPLREETVGSSTGNN
jgi:PAS domain S-box-containing protein